MLEFRPSLLAAAAIYTAQCSLRGFRYWTKTCELHTTYSEDQLLWVPPICSLISQKQWYDSSTNMFIAYVDDCVPVSARGWWWISTRRLELGSWQGYIENTALSNMAARQKQNQHTFCWTLGSSANFQRPNLEANPDFKMARFYIGCMRNRSSIGCNRSCRNWNNNNCVVLGVWFIQWISSFLTDNFVLIASIYFPSGKIR